MGHGTPVTFAAIERGVKVGLGCVSPSNRQCYHINHEVKQDCTSIVAAEMFTAMRISLVWQRGELFPLLHPGTSSSAIRTGQQNLSLAPMKAPKYAKYPGPVAFRLATLGGAEAAHVESKVGSIEVGKQADILLFDALSINLANVIDPFAGIVYHATAADIETVIIGGEIVKESGKLVRHDWKEVGSKLNQHIKEVKSRVEKANDLEKNYEGIVKSWQLQTV